MPRVLQVYGRCADFQTLRAIEQLSSGLGASFDVYTRTIGRGGDFRNVPSAALGLRDDLRQFDLVHAWGIGALSAAAFASSSGRIVFTPTPFPSRRQIGWIRAILNYRDVQVVCPTATLRRALVERGIPLPRCHLIRPGVDFARVKRRRDPALRAALALADDHHVLLGLGESTRAADHRQTVWGGAILNVLDHRTRVLLWGRGPMAPAAARLGQRLGQPELVTLAEQRLGRHLDFEDLLPAADMLVVSATTPVATLPIAIGMAAALPIVATVTSTIAELLEDRHTALMTQPAVPRLLAQRIMQLREDPQMQWSLADTARVEAYEFFSLSRFLDQFRALYTQVIEGRTAEVIEPAPGAGLRFHGRG
ncbi:MAG TPA: glycosyltransferase [Tepidisphaeraceae bacterium]|jgi:glycosyltransferase involved in cell wall biosynthesis